MNQILYIIIFMVGSTTFLAAQCCQDRHSTNAHDSWISCTTSNNPVSGQGNSHWIRYDFGQVQDLHESTFWNLNHPDPTERMWNVKKARIHYSLNGTNWTFWGVLSFPQATGDPKYEGFQGPDFNGAQARYMVITPFENYGGSCFGFAEMRINTEPSTAGSFNVNINPCINDGIFYGLDGGINEGGQYTGAGVINNYGDKFDFDPDEAGPGAHTITYQYVNASGDLVTQTSRVNVKNCGSAGCLPCPPCQFTQQPIFDANPILNGTFYDGPEISSSGTVDTAYNINFRGADAVVLNDGFEVKANSVFLAEIRDCESVNMLSNGDFSSGSVSPWVMELHQGSGAVLTLENGAAKVVTSNITGTSWHIQFEQFGMSMNAGQTYTLTFSARASGTRNIGMAVGRHNSPWNGYAYSGITVNNQWQNFSMQVTPDENNTNFVRVSALLGDAPAGTYWFDNIVLKP